MLISPHLPIRYPTNAVIGIIDTPEDVERAVLALRTGGFWESEVEVAAGEAAAEAVHASTGRTGITGLVVRVAQCLGAEDEEMDTRRTPSMRSATGTSWSWSRRQLKAESSGRPSSCERMPATR